MHRKENENGIGGTKVNKKIAVKWKTGPVKGEISVTRGRLAGEGTPGGAGTEDGKSLQFAFENDSACQWEIAVQEADVQSGKAAIVFVNEERHPFSFILDDVSRDYPIYIPSCGVVVTEGDDTRSYEQIERDIRGRGLVTNLQKMNLEPQESYEEAAKRTISMPSQTWLGLSRDMRIFSLGFRKEDLTNVIWDWVDIRLHGYEAALPENQDRPIRYQYMIGRGIGCKHEVHRRLEEGCLPILHTEIVDEDIRYQCTSFVSLESSPLQESTVRGTHYLAADNYGRGSMFTDAQREARDQVLEEEREREEETVLYFRIEAVNTAAVPRYAWFKSIEPGDDFADKAGCSFDSETGFAAYGADRIFCMTKVNGRPLANPETAVLIKPGESATIEFYMPHQPLSRARAEQLSQQRFDDRLEECRQYWRGKLARGASIKVPEPRIDEMIRAGLLHLDLISYGLEPEGTIVPAIGVYTAIGSESSPIIQFMDSMGREDVAKRSLMFFMDKQHDDGFIQNFGGYMLETGAALWSVGEHYRYTRDEVWLAEVKSKLLKSFHYLKAWRERNLKEELRGMGYGMLEGKTADPDDPFRSFMLNGYAYLGLSRLAEMLETGEPAAAEEIRTLAEELKRDIRTAFDEAAARSPVVPLGDGSWVPTCPPWVGHKGPVSLYAEGGKWYTHGSFVARDSILGPLYLLFQEVIRPDDPAADWLLNYHVELMHASNVAFSQPYYSIHPWVHLKRNEVKAFLKSYYNTFSGLADRETYSFWEHFYYASPHKTHEEAWFLMQTRWMLYMEERDTLRLLPGIPDNWMEDGKKIELTDAASYFGPISLDVRSRLESGIITARISCSSDRRPKRIELRIPHPSGRIPAEIEGGALSGHETVIIEPFQGEAAVTLRY